MSERTENSINSAFKSSVYLTELFFKCCVMSHDILIHEESNSDPLWMKFEIAKRYSANPEQFFIKV